MKPVDLIRLVLRDAGVNGVGQSPSAEENNDVFLHLNMMMGQWNRKRWLVYHLIDVAYTSTGATSYTVGTGGNFNTPRPDRIESAFARYVGQASPNQTDLPVKVLDAREDYNAIYLKGLNTGTFPSYVFYDAAYPTGVTYWWPSPMSGQVELHISIKQELAQFTDLVTDINLPNEYLEALTWNLAKRARIMFGMPASKDINDLATASLNTIRMANAQIPRMQFPDTMPGRRTYFNPYAGLS